jgi:NAD(P)H-dependent FMN reductase
MSQEIKLSIISGSHRQQSESVKIARAVEHQLSTLDGVSRDNVGVNLSVDLSVDLIDLANTKLPLWDVTFENIEQQQIELLADQLEDSDGFVFVVPEWHGMVPAAVKNFFLHYSGGQLAHKPALIIAVSAGEGGAYPIVELRSSSYKNSRICYLPEHLIIRRVQSVFNTDSENHPESQSYLERRMTHCLNLLVSYSLALRGVRQELPAETEFSNGM